jgi:hypothetical protein
LSGPLPHRPRRRRGAGEERQDDGKKVVRAIKQYKIGVEKVNPDGSDAALAVSKKAAIGCSFYWRLVSFMPDLESLPAFI